MNEEARRYLRHAVLHLIDAQKYVEHAIEKESPGSEKADLTVINFSLKKKIEFSKKLINVMRS